eukprot:TRINITY_DN1099_c0_g1_i2.p1 TRINITY_DN1099_c0_g1~~TRINITY_DN1099_c0_g1_i2.p1  ORF type:complete len:146 (-),score=18.34 TRINITY_DN1099_c0_g1_i2:51-488(-)
MLNRLLNLNKRYKTKGMLRKTRFTRMWDQFDSKMRQWEKIGLIEVSNHNFTDVVAPKQDISKVEDISKDSTLEEQLEGGVPFMITRQMKQRLATLGYNQSQINSMSPREAHNTILSNKRVKREIPHHIKKKLDNASSKSDSIIQL